MPSFPTVILPHHHLWTHRMPYLPSWHPTQYCVWSRNTFQQKKYINGLITIEWTCLTIYPFTKYVWLNWKTQKITEDSVTEPIRRKTFKEWDSVLQNAVYILNQRALYDVHSPNQGVQLGVATLSYLLTHLSNFCFPSWQLELYWFWELSLHRFLVPPSYTMVPLKWKMKLPPGYFGLLMYATEPTERKKQTGEGYLRMEGSVLISKWKSCCYTQWKQSGLCRNWIIKGNLTNMESGRQPMELLGPITHPQLQTQLEVTNLAR